MYKQTIPIPSLFTNKSACFTAACSVLFSVFVLFLAYPTCSLYPPHVLSTFPRFPFPGPFAPLSPLLTPRSITCCPTPSLLTMLTKTLSSQCFPSFFSVEAYAITSFLFYFISKLVLDPSVYFLAPPMQKVHRVFVGISQQSISIPQLVLYIYPYD